ncbi:hypothetical protein NIES4073_46080 [Kalymmatonema gypsitolerans NIES-4073]|nr:hypothetical protein NIES4073_46080 [Scytonema sp. NIES-4073]
MKYSKYQNFAEKTIITFLELLKNQFQIFSDISQDFPQLQKQLALTNTPSSAAKEIIAWCSQYREVAEALNSYRELKNLAKYNYRGQELIEINTILQASQQTQDKNTLQASEQAQDKTQSSS